MTTTPQILKVSEAPKLDLRLAFELPGQCQIGLCSLSRKVEQEHLARLEAHIPTILSTLWKPNCICEGQTAELLVIAFLPHKSVINLQFYFL